MPSTTTSPPYNHSVNSSSTESNGSDYSQSTVPTVYSDRARRTLKNHDIVDPYYRVDARDSTETYASTIPSFEDLSQKPQFEVVNDRYEIFPSDAVPSTPSTFGDLFPSTRRLQIRHDDTTIDGNMNLRIDTLAPLQGCQLREVTLFHLRMHDLRNRKFSLRRYCRDSGQEVCHSSRKYQQPTADKRSSLQRSLSTVLSSLRPRSEPSSPTSPNLKRQDSGYKSGSEENYFDIDRVDEDWDGDESDDSSRDSIPTPTTQLEFSNYAHVDVTRRGTKSSKRYEYEYWCTKYQWKRVSRKDGGFHEISYHLINTTTSKSVAHIIPEPLSPLEVVEEESKGGWVPPSSMWISDPAVFAKMKDVAE
ncbi:hypothetical protein FQN54_002252 [Arachnomyces sp. PD_36]|nr:hypothetical protein FQN54_002252 [Arachnomyces sp. PD_36]